MSNTKPKLYPTSPHADYPFIKQTEDEIRERQFRRGFTQGVWAAIECVERGDNLKSMKSWYMRLLRWRGANHRGKTVWPEWYGRRAE